MSNPFATATKVAVFTQQRGPTPFTAWHAALREAFETPQDIAPEPDPMEPAIDVAAITEDAFASGFDEGFAAGRAEAEGERARLRALAAGLEALRPEPTPALGGMIAATVERLLTELMGQVRIDRDTLVARAIAAAALIGEETRPAMLRLHPDDLALLDGADLPVPAEADATLVPGSLKLETAQGWIEDGPAQRLERLRIALDRVEAAR
jgi:flagellar assembly protein FliH